MSIDPRLVTIFRTALPASETAGSITLDSKMEDVAGWDSQTFVAIVVGIEETFGIELTTLDAARMSSIRAIYEVLAEKGIGLAP
jgi:acyl carrier protein